MTPAASIGPEQTPAPSAVKGSPPEFANGLRFTVLIPTYKRPADLNRCLEALSKQDLSPTTILIVRRTDDAGSKEIVEKWSPKLRVEEVCVDLPGQVHALNTGLDWIAERRDRQGSDEARIGDTLVCILDDDTAPHARWLARIAAIVAAEPNVGGVGGRDHNFIGGRPQTGEASPVGTILWYGRFIGNHHLGGGPRRDVDFLKGANMAYRMSAIGDLRFDKRLLGSGAQVHNDLAFSMGVRNRGWRLVYDPEVSIDHFSAERFDSDIRGAFAHDAAENTACNFYLTIRWYVEPWPRKMMALLYARLVGVRHIPGFLRGIWFRLRSNENGVAFRAASVRAWRKAREIAG